MKQIKQKIPTKLLIVLAILMGSIAVTFFAVYSRFNQRPKAILATTLRLVPPSSSVRVGETFTLPVEITTLRQAVVTDLAILYDKTKVELVNIVPGPFFPQAQELINVRDRQPTHASQGLLYYSVHVKSDLQPQTGSGTVAVITLRAKAAGTAQFSFQSPLTIVGAIGSDQNVLTGTIDAQYSIESPQVCWNRVITQNTEFFWPDGCLGNNLPDQICTQALVSLTPEEKNGYDAWVSGGSLPIPDCGPGPVPTCVPRPPCLDSEPRCLLPETPDMCPPGCFYQEVQCVTEPCDPILVCPTTSPTPTCSPPPPCMYEGILDSNGNRVFCAVDLLPGGFWCPRPTPTGTVIPSATPYRSPTPTSAQDMYLLNMGQYGNIVTAVHGPNSGYAVMAILYKNDQVVTDQRDIVYTWSIDNPQIAEISPFDGCTNGIQPPCPLDHLSIHALQPGYTNIHVNAAFRSNPGVWLASATFNLTVVPADKPTIMEFLVKFAGVTDGSADGAHATFRFTLGTQFDVITQPITLTHNGNGVYKALISMKKSDLPEGYGYTVTVKGEKHVSRKFCKQSGQSTPCTEISQMGINLPAADTIHFDFTGLPLEPGDVPPQDGVADSRDFTAIRNRLSIACSNLTAQDKHIADLDYNGCVNIKDAFLMRKTLETRYDEF